MWLINRGHMLLQLDRISEAKADFEQAQAMLKVDKNPDETIVKESLAGS